MRPVVALAEWLSLSELDTIFALQEEGFLRDEVEGVALVEGEWTDDHIARYNQVLRVITVDGDKPKDFVSLS